MGMKGQCWMVKNSGAKVSSEATPFATLGSPARYPWWMKSVERRRLNERTWTAAKNPKRPAVSGLWWGLLWVYLGFSMIFFCWFKVQSNRSFPMMKKHISQCRNGIYPPFGIRNFLPSTAAKPGCLPQEPGFSCRMGKRFDEAPGNLLARRLGVTTAFLVLSCKSVVAMSFQSMIVWRELA